MDEQMIGHVLDLAQRGKGALQIPRVPQDDGGDEQVKV